MILIPPLSFFRKTIFGGSLLMRIPNPSSSFSMTRFSVSGLLTSRTMKIKWQVFATAMTCRPRPFPSFAPWMIPGRSSIWIAAPLYITWPGTVVKVVNSYAAATKHQPTRDWVTCSFAPSECCPVNLLMSVLFPTDGKPIKPTLATPVRATSKPATADQIHTKLI